MNCVSAMTTEQDGLSLVAQLQGRSFEPRSVSPPPQSERTSSTPGPGLSPSQSCGLPEKACKGDHTLCHLLRSTPSPQLRAEGHPGSARTNSVFLFTAGHPTCQLAYLSPAQGLEGGAVRNTCAHITEISAETPMIENHVKFTHIFSRKT